MALSKSMWTRLFLYLRVGVVETNDGWTHTFMTSDERLQNSAISTYSFRRLKVAACGVSSDAFAQKVIVMAKNRMGAALLYTIMEGFDELGRRHCIHEMNIEHVDAMNTRKFIWFPPLTSCTRETVNTFGSTPFRLVKMYTNLKVSPTDHTRITVRLYYPRIDYADRLTDRDWSVLHRAYTCKP